MLDEPFHWSTKHWRALQGYANTLKLFRHPRVALPVICSIGEYEALLNLVEEGANVVELLRDYLLTDRALPLEHQLGDAHGSMHIPTHVDAGFKTMYERWVEVLQFDG